MLICCDINILYFLSKKKKKLSAVMGLTLLKTVVCVTHF